METPALFAKLHLNQSNRSPRGFNATFVGIDFHRTNHECNEIITQIRSLFNGFKRIINLTNSSQAIHCLYLH